jgi:hypothetical protein
MPSIKLYEHSLGEVPRKVHHLYVLDAERGGYRLQVSDLESHIHGLKSALAVERQTVREQKLQITELRQQNAVVSVGGE